MVKLQQITRTNQTSVYFIYLDPKEIEFRNWKKGDEFTVEFKNTTIIINKTKQ
jgi:hypothetical protein